MAEKEEPLHGGAGGGGGGVLELVERPLVDARVVEKVLVDVTVSEKQERQSVYELVADHVATEHQGELTVREHLEAAGIRQTVVADPHADPRAPVAPMMRIDHVEAAALLARFKAQGLTGETRIPKDVFDQALHEARHGRI